MRKIGHNRTLWILVGLMAATACTPMAEGVQKMGDNSKKMIYDTKNSWSDLFTYAPKASTPQLPQTRYCYRTLSDVVCYDSVQPTLTSHLDGYQDGENISWVQPGGGSLGVSGGMPTAAPGAEHAQVSPTAQAAVDVTSNTAPATSGADSISTAPIEAPAAQAAPSAPSKSKPFYNKESPYKKGAK
ncbi:MAG: hypothetical protein B7X02_00715 [Rhodospirillales bacterium 12-54-5]|nr:MAG: hypothetical protein B7X02_00715 [Rhodospirillales bacterium 12-54-5]